MKNLIAVGLLLMSPFMLCDVHAASVNEERDLFETLFTDWTHAFNHKDLPASCHLFAKEMVANYQGFPPKNYQSICDGFKKIFHEQKQYHYHFKLHEIYRSQALAAIRITWYLAIYENNKLLSQTQDEGLDVLQKNSHGEWQIINYLAYPIPS